MSAKVFWLIVAAMALMGIALLLYQATTNPQRIDPHAAKEIEKAKRR